MKDSLFEVSHRIRPEPRARAIKGSLFEVSQRIRRETQSYERFFVWSKSKNKTWNPELELQKILSLK